MAKEIIVSVWCDPCAKDGVREPGQTTPPLTIGNAKPRTLDLCERHRKELLDALVSALDEDGADLGGAAAKTGKGAAESVSRLPYGSANAPGPFDCLVPDCGGRHTVKKGGRGYPSPKALQNHLAYQHGVTMADYIEQYGVPVSLTTGEPLARGTDPDTKLACEECGKVFHGQHALSGHMGVHRARGAQAG